MKLEVKITISVTKAKKKSPAPKKQTPGNSKNLTVNINQK